jgi:hypothetical protein
VLVLVFVNEELATFKANALANFHDIFDVLNEEDGAGELNMAKISRGINIRQSVGGADDPGLEDTHAGVKESAYDWLIIDIRVPTGHLDHGILSNFLGR